MTIVHSHLGVPFHKPPPGAHENNWARSLSREISEWPRHAVIIDNDIGDKCETLPSSSDLSPAGVKAISQWWRERKPSCLQAKIHCLWGRDKSKCLLPLGRGRKSPGPRILHNTKQRSATMW